MAEDDEDTDELEEKFKATLRMTQEKQLARASGQWTGDTDTSEMNFSVVKAMFSYKPKTEDGLAFKRGDLITVIGDCDKSQPTWTGTLQETGETGTFPSKLVKPVE